MHVNRVCRSSRSSSSRSRSSRVLHQCDEGAAAASFAAASASGGGIGIGTYGRVDFGSGVGSKLLGILLEARRLALDLGRDLVDVGCDGQECVSMQVN